MADPRDPLDPRGVIECATARDQRLTSRVPPIFSMSAAEWGAKLADKHGPPIYCLECSRTTVMLLEVALMEGNRERDLLREQLDQAHQQIARLNETLRLKAWESVTVQEQELNT